MTNAKTILFWNEKGGPGKTTLSTHFAAGLAIFNENSRVLMIDADQQANTTEVLALNKAPKFYDLCVRDASWKDVVLPVHPDVYSPPNAAAKGKLFAIPGNSETIGIVSQIQDARKLVARFAEFSRMFTHIVIDINPTPTLLHNIMATVSTHLVIPTEPEVFSVETGVKQTLERTQELRDKGRAQLLGIVPNKFRSKTAMHNGFLKELKKTYGADVLSPIPLAIALGESQYHRQFLYGLAPDFTATKAITRMVKELTQRMGEKVNG